MLALSTEQSQTHQRRGIVLVLILGMLSLLALIGVTFATFSGQAQIGARNYNRDFRRPSIDTLFEYALSQLINDTDNPLSAIRGHSLKRDMYGNDGNQNGFVDRLPLPFGPYLKFTPTSPPADPLFPGNTVLATNIPVNVAIPNIAGRDFSRWVLRINQFTAPASPPNPLFRVAQSIEILNDRPINGFHVFTLANWDLSLALAQPAHAVMPSGPSFFVLDGRYRNAFNGPGMNQRSAFANFRYNSALINPTTNLGNPVTIYGLGNPDLPTIGMDEDYDACDLENWFLAIQSADGEVAIPSFHRPGIISGVADPNAVISGVPQDEWTIPAPGDSRLTTPILVNKSIRAVAKLLRPRAVDHPNAGQGAFPDLRPDRSGTPVTNQNFGKITYDVDNDNDGKTDSVWLDLGYPAQRDPQSNKLYKPMFAFMVIGLNGRMPLNTVGNLQGRGIADSGGSFNLNQPNFDHASNVGYSPNEINPKFALQNAAPIDTSQISLPPLAGFGQIDNAGEWLSLTQLRNLLAGTRLPGTNNGDTNFALVGGQPVQIPNNLYDQFDVIQTGNPPYVDRSRALAVSGRFGESQQGVSGRIFGPATGVEHDPRVLSYNNTTRPGRSRPIWSGNELDMTDDDYNTLDIGNSNPSILNEGTNSSDPSGSVLLPVERMQRFVTPLDIAGTGRVYRWDDYPTAIDPELTGLFGTGFTPFGLGPDTFGRVVFYRHFRPPGFPAGFDLSITQDTIPRPPTEPQIDPVINRFHGYETFRNPFFNHPTLATDPIAAGSLPFDNDPTGTFNDQAANTKAPSYVVPSVINSRQEVIARGTASPPSPSAPIKGFAFGSPALNSGTEMNLYSQSSFDEPFNFRDLEWLYRQKDRDGRSLTSRLGQLAPVSFRESPDAEMRRRMFSIDTWELNTFSWSHDNPGLLTAQANNSWFGGPINQQANAGVANLQALLLPLGQPPAPPTAGPYPVLSSSVRPYAHRILPLETPALAHRGRRINLNMPLPISNDPNEQVRQKWVRDTYNLLKMILPPKATDTPQELAQLSQYAVNIVDFRDADSTMTRFVNYDLSPIIGSTTTVPGIQFATTPTPTGNTNPLVQFGMEYQPVALNEAMGFSFLRGNRGTSEATPRIMIELVNMLTDARGDSKAAWLKLMNWDVVLRPDDNEGRPHPITGEFAPVTMGVTPNFDLSGLTLSPVKKDETDPNNLDNNPNYYHVLGTEPIAAGYEASAPNADTVIPKTSEFHKYLTSKQQLTSPGDGRYLWVYLRRPANPMDVPSPNNPMVVVDSIRFPYIEGTGTLTDQGMGNFTYDANSGSDLYSVGRRQPYRGGHLFNAPGTLPATAYGYSEQVPPSSGGSGTYTGLTDVGSSNTERITERIRHTLGRGNANRDAAREYFVFNDRDFNSVAELTLVPGSAPGLFTKQFLERSYNPIRPLTTEWTLPKPRGQTAPNQNDANLYSQTMSDSTSRTYPYLINGFWYSAKSEDTTTPRPGPVGAAPYPLAPVVGGWSNGGWYKILEFFDVPSPMNGSIGPVASGENFDWQRQDLRPGQLNLNLIIDEEVFFGLLDDPRLSRAVLPIKDMLTSAGYSMPISPTSATMITAYNQPDLIPLVATEAGLTGYPSYAYPMHGWMKPDFTPIPPATFGYMNSRGFFDALSTFPQKAFMKAAFADFLKLRHGGSNFLFGFGGGPVGSQETDIPGGFLPTLPAERPFRSLSYPDINSTVMRPATLPRQQPPVLINGTPTIAWTVDPQPVDAIPPTTPTAPPTSYVGDPGVLNPFIDIQNTTTAAPPTPTRRLFQLHDYTAPPPMPPASPGPPSNASLVGLAAVMEPFVSLNLNNPSASLFRDDDFTQTYPAGRVTLGGLTDSMAGVVDRRDHPTYRIEMLQKVMNLTTTRTHQYAVWVTIGLFEVIRPGNPSRGVPDLLGPELGKAAGKEIRYRSFFVVDRTRATGFNHPLYPGDYRDCVVYRRRIE